MCFTASSGTGGGIIAFDINLGCSGFVYGLSITSSIMHTSGAKYGLLLAGDTVAREFNTRHCTKTTHAASLLFGDAGTATLLEKVEGEILRYSLNTDGSQYKAIIAPYGFWRNPDMPPAKGNDSMMDDVSVFNFATNDVPIQINEYMNKFATSVKDYDCLVLHQANLMIMKRIAKKTGFPIDKMLISLDRFGNTSSASIPATLVAAYGEKNSDVKINALCCGFGVGLSWGTIGIHVSIADILPLVHTDNFFDDGYNLEET